MLGTQKMAFPGFKFQKFSGGECPRTPLIMRGFGVRHGQGFRLDPRLPCAHAQTLFTFWTAIFVKYDILTEYLTLFWFAILVNEYKKYVLIQKSSKDAKFVMSRTDAQNGVDIIFNYSIIWWYLWINWIYCTIWQCKSGRDTQFMTSLSDTRITNAI